MGLAAWWHVASSQTRDQQGLNLCHQLWQVDSQPLDYQVSSTYRLLGTSLDHFFPHFDVPMCQYLFLESPSCAHCSVMSPLSQSSIQVALSTEFLSISGEMDLGVPYIQKSMDSTNCILYIQYCTYLCLKIQV